jgi:hypothetical protein
MTNEGQREKNIWLYITPNERLDMIGKMTLEGHFKKKGTIGMITPESYSNFWLFLVTKKDELNQMNSFTQKEPYCHFRTHLIGIYSHERKIYSILRTILAGPKHPRANKLLT